MSLSNSTARRRWDHFVGAFAGKTALYVVLVLVSVPFILPALWMFVTSLATSDQVFVYPPRFFPVQWEWGNYARVFEMQPFAQQFFNSLYIAVIVAAGTVFFASLAGYAFARLRFPGQGILFLVLMTGFFIPEEVTIIPLYRLVAGLGLVNTHWPLIILPIFSGGGVIATFIMRQAFLSLPRELEDAARIDGLGWFRTFWTIAFPLVAPSVSVIVILSSLGSWNMFLEPLVFLRDPNLFTLPLALTFFQSATGEKIWNVQMAATVLSVLPIIIVFIAAQRQIISGLTSGSIKG